MDTVMPNLLGAWMGFLLGVLSGMGPGLMFHKAEWLGGYGSWPRRMMRLGHISFFGLGFINLAFALTARSLQLDTGLATPAWLLLIAAVTMPLVCYLSAWKTVLRHAFVVPVLTATFGIAIFLWRLLTS